MKATGIVRRIDELGRVVIPKEIRRTLLYPRRLMRLRSIPTAKAGSSIKKYSLVGELCDFAKEYAESIQQSVGHIAAICDKDTIIAISSPHRAYCNRLSACRLTNRYTMTLRPLCKCARSLTAARQRRRNDRNHSER